MPRRTLQCQAALGGKVFRYTLADALAKGPVVLYFFPAAFSDGCSIEAHEFAEAIGQFEALGASVIGVSGDDMDTDRASSRCRPARASFRWPPTRRRAVIKAFDAVMETRPTTPTACPT